MFYKIQDTTLKGIANAIRQQRGDDSKMYVEDMEQLILDIQGSGSGLQNVEVGVVTMPATKYINMGVPNMTDSPMIIPHKLGRSPMFFSIVPVNSHDGVGQGIGCLGTAAAAYTVRTGNTIKYSSQYTWSGSSSGDTMSRSVSTVCPRSDAFGNSGVVLAHDKVMVYSRQGDASPAIYKGGIVAKGTTYIYVLGCYETPKIAPSKILTSANSLTILAKDKQILFASTPEGETCTELIWFESSDNSVVTIDPIYGLYTAVAPGNAVIKVHCGSMIKEIPVTVPDSVYDEFNYQYSDYSDYDLDTYNLVDSSSLKAYMYLLPSGHEYKFNTGSNSSHKYGVMYFGEESKGYTQRGYNASTANTYIQLSNNPDGSQRMAQVIFVTARTKTLTVTDNLGVVWGEIHPAYENELPQLVETYQGRRLYSITSGWENNESYVTYVYKVVPNSKVSVFLTSTLRHLHIFTGATSDFSSFKSANSSNSTSYLNASVPSDGEYLYVCTDAGTFIRYII